jgi:hypothetical protein
MATQVPKRKENISRKSPRAYKMTPFIPRCRQDLWWSPKEGYHFLPWRTSCLVHGGQFPEATLMWSSKDFFPFTFS